MLVTQEPAFTVSITVFSKLMKVLINYKFNLEIQLLNMGSITFCYREEGKREEREREEKQKG